MDKKQLSEKTALELLINSNAIRHKKDMPNRPK